MKILGALVCVLFVSCGGSSSTGDSGGGRNKASLACDHFRNVAYDAGEGLLTDSELRSKLREIYDNAIIAPPEVENAAKAMLRAATSGNTYSLTKAVEKMDAACSAAGS